jgi:hypothetical protein
MCFDLSLQCQEGDLFRIFSIFGSLQSLDIRGDQAFVNYYTTAAADYAFAELGSENNFRINSAAPALYGKALLVRRRTQSSSSGYLADWLRSDETIRQANEFFGFGGWSCTVHELQELETVTKDCDDECEESSDERSAKKGRPSVEYREVEGGAQQSSNDKSSAGGGGGGLFRSHWFAIVSLRLPQHLNPKIAGLLSGGIKGQGYGLAGASDMVEAVGLAKKAAVNLARCAAFRRICLVLLDGILRFAHVLPPEPEIETSIVWQTNRAPKPHKSELPRRTSGGTSELVGGFEEDANGDGEENVRSRSGGGRADEEIAGANQTLEALDREDRSRLPERGVTGNWRLARALQSAESAPPSEATLYFAKQQWQDTSNR